jgi:hypothetical protein
MKTEIPLSAPAEPGSQHCRKVGSFIEKGGCFALRCDDGEELWLEIDPIPLHMLDERVEITGQPFGATLIWVENIGPIRSFS